MTHRKPSSNVLANLLATLACGALLASAPLAAQESGEPAPASRAKTLAAFERRLEDYVATKKSLDAGLPSAKPGDTTAAVEARKKMLAERLKRARRDAKPGDLFGDAAPILKQIIEKDAANRGVRDAYAAMQEVPPQNPPMLNAAYPERAALATVPPLILVNLPRLPDNMEYRFMGRDLILRDRDSNLILDFVAGAVPAIRPNTPHTQPTTTAPPADEAPSTAPSTPR